MGKTTLYILFICLFISTGLASYTYEVETYGDNKTLHDEETILVYLQGGMDGLSLYNNSSATIQETSTLVQGSGGIWTLYQYDSSSLTFSSGELSKLIINSNATATLTGGLIQSIYSYQIATTTIPDEPPVVVPNPHITIVYSGVLPTYNETTDILSGLWGNGNPFGIYLHDVAGYSPVIENIQFELIPEPATLALLGFGGLLIRRKK